MSSIGRARHASILEVGLLVRIGDPEDYLGCDLVTMRGIPDVSETK